MASVIQSKQAGGEDNREAAGGQVQSPYTQPGTLGGKGPRREQETEEERSLTLEGGREPACPPHSRVVWRRGFAEPTPAELGLELSLMTLSLVLSLHRPCAASSGERPRANVPSSCWFRE